MIALFSLWGKDKVPLEKTERPAGRDKMVSEYFFLVYTKTVDSVFRALWLAAQSVNIQHYSLIHLQFLRASDGDAKLA